MKIKEKHKRSVRNIILFFAVCILISFIVLTILFATKVIYFDNGINFNKDLFLAIKDKWYIYPIFILIQIIMTVLLCFIPGVSAGMIGLGIALFGANWKCFLTCYCGVILSSVVLHESNQAFQPSSLIALLLVSLSVFLVNKETQTD